MDYQEAIRKVGHLLKLAERGGTPEEAATAFAKAQEIITKYRLNVDDLDFDANQSKEDAEPVKDFGFSDPLDSVPNNTHYRVQWTLRLATLVAYHNQCAVRWSKHGGKNSGAAYRVIGRPSDVQAVRYLYGFFRNQIDALRREHCVGNSSTYIGEFCTGCVDTLDRKLDEQFKKSVAEAQAAKSSNSLALVRVNNAVARIEKRRQDVDDFINGENVRKITSWTGLPENVVTLFWNGKNEDAKKLFPNFRDFQAALKAYRSCFSGGGRGYSGAGSQVSTGGRAAGQKAGESIRTTGARAALGSTRKAIE